MILNSRIKVTKVFMEFALRLAGTSIKNKRYFSGTPALSFCRCWSPDQQLPYLVPNAVGQTTNCGVSEPVIF
jgi:hypothetical protein